MRSFSALLVLLVLVRTVFGQLPLGVVDTQPNGDTPPSPTESLAKITVPDGFRVTLFAGEPDVYQPIAMEFDDRGRLWVVENFSYPDWQSENRDRILIFGDNDNDGRFDQRTVFADNLSNITGIALGFGGVWCCSTPNFVFIPDRDQDDRPDGPPEIKLDGWNDDSDDIEHNVFNGMTWGPDGWMYGSHGILADSFIGKPGTPKEERLQINCGIWRYHPVRDEVEIVAHGTTNPWGIDFDDYGQGFFTNCVIGHLWHLIPGAHYKRMYGNHFNPHAYELVDACSDHFHWGEGRWTESRGGIGMHSEAGGGHAHVGAMIYRGGTWPEEYHGSMFTANLHGNRLNRDTLERRGSGYVAKHAPDFFHGNDPWLRGIAVKYGPDGNVYVSDWTDLGECHDKDGTHRSSGRIYKITYGDAKPNEIQDVSKLSNPELLKLSTHPNAWYWQHARRVLHERATNGDDMTEAIELTKQLEGMSTPNQLKMLNARNLMSGVSKPTVIQLLTSDDEHVQGWAIRQLADTDDVDHESYATLLQVAREATPKVQLELCSLLQTSVGRSEWIAGIATQLMQRFPTNDDPNLLSMFWMTIEQLATPHDMPLLLRLAHHGQQNPKLKPIRQFIARRVLADDPSDVHAMRTVLNLVDRSTPAAQHDLLQGVRIALQSGRPKTMPVKWPKLKEKIEERSTEMEQLLAELSLKFQDESAIRDFKRAVVDSQVDLDYRRECLRVLAENEIGGTLDILKRMLNDGDLRLDAIQALSRFNDESVPVSLVSAFKDYRPSEQQAAIATLTTRKAYAAALLDAVANQTIPAEAIKPSQAAEIYQMGEELRSQLKEHWGDLRRSNREKSQEIADWKARLGSKKLGEPNLGNGSKLYAENCGKCHKLFGDGGEIGPDLTGSDRRNLDYILQNVITPSAVVGKDYRLQTIVKTDGLTVSGALREQTKASVVVQTTEKRITISRDQIESIEETELSLMPEGQFDKMSEEDVRDIVAYLASDP